MAESGPRGGSYGWLALVVAATAGVLAALHFAASVFTPIFLAVVLALVIAPLHTALQRRGVKAWVSLLVVMLGLLVGCALVVIVVGYSLSHVGDQMRVYAERWTAEFERLDALLASSGLAGVNLADMLSPEASLGAFGTVLGALIDVATTTVIVLILMVFLLAEGSAIVGRLREALGANNPAFLRLTAYGRDVGVYFALRAAVNAATGVGVALVLFLLGVDFPVLWGIVTFFLSFIPYVGMFLASVPSVLLALAEFGPGRALVVIVALTLVNALAENLLQPTLMSRGLRLSPTFVFVSLLFWSWLLGGGGSFLAIPLSLGAVAVLASFTNARWLAAAVTVCEPANAEPPPEA